MLSDSVATQNLCPLQMEDVQVITESPIGEL